LKLFEFIVSVVFYLFNIIQTHEYLSVTLKSLKNFQDTKAELY